MATAQIMLPLLGGIPYASSPPGIGWAGSRPCLLFDDTTDELLTWSFRMPDNYASGLTAKWQYSMVSATTGVVAVRAQVMAASVGDPVNVDSYDTLQASSDDTVPATAGNVKEISLTLVNADGLVAGDHIAVQLGRENGTTGTNAIGDMAVWAIALTYTVV